MTLSLSLSLSLSLCVCAHCTMSFSKADALNLKSLGKIRALLLALVNRLRGVKSRLILLVNLVRFNCSFLACFNGAKSSDHNLSCT